MTLESEIRLLEEELGRLRDDGIVTPTTSISSGIEDFDKIIQTLKSNERLLKSKVRSEQAAPCPRIPPHFLLFSGTFVVCDRCSVYLLSI